MSPDLFPVSLDPSSDDPEVQWMDMALQLAERGRARAAPNPVVGALVVREGRVVGRGYHRACGGPHAEIEALQGLQDVRGATVIVSLEPCCFHGRTPPCADALIAAGVGRVVVGCLDPNPRVAGQGVERLRAAGIEVRVGVRERASQLKNGPFFINQLQQRSFCTAKWAMSLDGKIATRSGHSQWISHQTSRDTVQQLRDQVGAILVGGRTARIDDPRLTCRLPGGRSPVRVVLSSCADVPLAGQLVQTAHQVPVWIFCQSVPDDREQALRDAGCEVVLCPASGSGIKPVFVLQELYRRGISEVLVEGGAQVLGGFVDAGLVDRCLVFVAPKVLGGAGPSPVGGRGAATVDAGLELSDVSWQASASDQLAIGYNWKH